MIQLIYFLSLITGLLTLYDLSGRLITQYKLVYFPIRFFAVSSASRHYNFVSLFGFFLALLLCLSLRFRLFSRSHSLSFTLSIPYSSPFMLFLPLCATYLKKIATLFLVVFQNFCLF